MSAHPRLRDSGNLLLDQLTDADFETLEPSLQRVSLALRQIVHEFEADVAHIYFPTTALMSLMTVLEEDDPIEAATVGREGFVGLAQALGVEASPHVAMCQMAGESLRVPVRPFLEVLGRRPGLTRLLHRYVAFSLRLVGQGVACNALHPIEARASRWLLMVHDQARRDEFPLTQEFLAYMLGVRRQTVTVVAGALQNAGLIGYRRGVITVVDRPRLEEAACECYASMRGYYRRIVAEAPDGGITGGCRHAQKFPRECPPADRRPRESSHILVDDRRSQAGGGTASPSQQAPWNGEGWAATR